MIIISKRKRLNSAVHRLFCSVDISHWVVNWNKQVVGEVSRG